MTPRHLVLHGLAIKKHGTPTDIAALTVLSEEETRRQLAALAASGRAIESRHLVRQRLRQRIYFIPGVEHRFALGTEFFQHHAHRIALPRPKRVTRVDDMDEQVCVGHFFQRGAECGNQFLWQIADESDGIRENGIHAVF